MRAEDKLKLGSREAKRIAVIADESINVSHHFGKVPFYTVLTIEDGK